MLAAEKTLLFFITPGNPQPTLPFQLNSLIIFDWIPLIIFFGFDGFGVENLIFSETGNLINTTVYDGNKLTAGNLINGPAVIEEDTTTLVIEPEWLLELHKSGTYIINRKDH